MQDRQPTNSMSYQQFQQQRFVMQEQQAVQAQQAIQTAGADSFSQKVMDTIQSLRQIGTDLYNAQKQLEAQIGAQQRQLQQMQHNIETICNQLQNSFKQQNAGSPLVQ